ncbi:hypothetical protein GF319_04465 [Candidatus Bathyarchaeota archaeon]|nr:hypothetical protein [Candidatus Bathyarchaeota archaeon]
MEEGKSQSFPVWPFILLSIFTGGFVYLIYFGIRKSIDKKLPRTNLQKKIEKPMNLYFLTFVTISLILYGTIFGNVVEYIQSFTQNNLVHVMTIDFLLLSILFPGLMIDDMMREESYDLRRFLLFSAGSVLGANMYLLQRLRKNG